MNDPMDRIKKADGTHVEVPATQSTYNAVSRWNKRNGGSAATASYKGKAYVLFL